MINFLAVVYYKVLKSVTFFKKNILANSANPDEILHSVSPYLVCTVNVSIHIFLV